MNNILRVAIGAKTQTGKARCRKKSDTETRRARYIVRRPSNTVL